MARVALVTGAARGIGLELCRLLLEDGETVFACPRVRGSEGLAELARKYDGRLREFAMDVGDDASVAATAREIGERTERIDLLFNNAGVYPKDAGVDELDPDGLRLAFEINAIGPLRVVRAFLPLLRRGSDKRLIQVTSLMGSIADNTSGGSYAYRMSKAALNMATRNLAHDLGGEGFLALAIHPGWVQTRMGGSHAPLQLREATEDVLNVALSTPSRENGAFKGPGGRTLPY